MVLEEIEAGLERGEVPLRIYGDPEIYRLECERVFGRCWNYLAHESEIPNPGDYVLRYIADTPLIVTRDAAGRVHVLFDSCRHRGPRLCPADVGNTAAYRCAYHGWTYGLDGRLIGVPSRERYPALDEEKWGLLAPRVGIYRGLIFACLDDRTESLEDYLGDFRWYLDIHFALSPPMEVAGPPLRWVLPGNWKSGAENFAGDSYHTQTLHRSVSQTGLTGFTKPTGTYDVHVTECGGHATSASRVAPDVVGFWGSAPDYADHLRAGGCTPEQIDFARSSMTGQGTIFPNASFIHGNTTDATEHESAPYLGFALWRPKSPTTTEVWRWVFVPSWYTEEQKRRSHRVAISSFGPAGNAEQDDTVVWSGTAAAGASRFAQNANAKLNYTMSHPAFGGEQPMRDAPGPGVVFNRRLEDGVQRTILRNWIGRMRRE
jgi:phenylpropionate dioxygenase-like ring-hydroxylating dioxygenase large terminal subunit